MGNSNATRRITVPNDEPTDVIRVSESVAKRIRGATDDSGQHKTNLKPTDNYPTAFPGYSPQYYPPPESLTALQIRHEKEEELKRNEEYWMKRLQQQQETNKAMNRFMEEQYENAVTEVKDSFYSCPDPNDEVPCRDAKDIVAKCYQEYPNEVLKCNKEVLAFQACVDAKRLSKIESRG